MEREILFSDQTLFPFKKPHNVILVEVSRSARKGFSQSVSLVSVTQTQGCNSFLPRVLGEDISSS